MIHRRLRRLERDAVLPRCLREGLGIFQPQLHLLRLLAALLHQQLVAGLRIERQPRGLVPQPGRKDCGIGQAQRNLAPPLGQHFELHLGRNANHVLADDRFAFDLCRQRPKRRLRVGRPLLGIAGRLPEGQEFVVRQEHAAAFLLEDLAQLAVRDVDAHLAIDLRSFLLFHRRRRRSASAGGS